MVQVGERTYRLTEFGIQALDRNLPQGIQRTIMNDLFQNESLSALEIVDGYPSIEPEMLQRIMSDLIQRNWVVTF